MPTFRCFVVKAKNNENVRTHDFEAKDIDAAHLVMSTTHLKRGESIDQVVQLAEEGVGTQPTADELEATIARLQKQLEAMRR